MGKLTYGMMMSLDGFVADASRHFDDEVLGFINHETRKVGTDQVQGGTGFSHLSFEAAMGRSTCRHGKA